MVEVNTGAEELPACPDSFVVGVRSGCARIKDDSHICRVRQAKERSSGGRGQMAKDWGMS